MWLYLSLEIVQNWHRKLTNNFFEKVDVLHHTLSKYLMELTLPEYEFCHYPPSQLAAAALCLSLK